MRDDDPVSSPPVILLVDDEEAVRTLLNRVLTQCGFAVSLVSSAAQALQAYRQHHALIALVLLKCDLPDGEGPVTLAGLQAVNPQVRCWFTTDDSDRHTEEELLQCGAARTLRKPIDPDELRKLLAALAAELAPRESLSTP